MADLKPEDLYGACPACSGTGQTVASGFSTGFSSDTAGGNRITRTLGTQDCVECNGIGKRLTASGRAIASLLELMKAHPQLR